MANLVLEELLARSSDESVSALMRGRLATDIEAAIFPNMHQSSKLLTRQADARVVSMLVYAVCTVCCRSQCFRHWNLDEPTMCVGT